MKKNVAIIITRMIPGGASKIVHDIIKHGTKKYNFTLFTGPEGVNIDELKKDFDKIEIIPTLLRNINPLYDIKAYFSILKKLKEQTFDIAHTHTSKAGFIGRLAAKKAEIATVIHSTHGTIFTDENNIEGASSRLAKKLFMYAERFASKNTSYTTVLSKNEKLISEKLKLADKKNTIVVPNGIDSKTFKLSQNARSEIRNKYSIKKEDILLLNVGRLSSEKGHSTLISAYKLALKTIPKLKLMIVGDGPEIANLKEKAYSDRSYDSKIIFTGHQTNTQKYFSAGDIFILPSLYEGFGLVILEAMATGLPIIASKTGGVPEIIKDNINGILFPPSDINNLTKKIITLTSSPDKIKDLIKESKKTVEKYSLKKMLGEYFNLYEN